MGHVETGGIQKELVGSGQGALGKYRTVVVGRAGMGAFLFFEIVTGLLGALPGGVGAVLRRVAYRPLFRSMGPEVRISRNVVFRRPGAIALAAGVTLRDGVVLDAKAESSEIHVGADAELGAGTILSCNGERMDIGEGVSVGASCRLGCLKGLEVGRGTRLGDCVCISGAGHAYDRLDVPIILQSLTCKGKTTIGQNVRVGDEATVLDGVTIGDGAVVAPRSLVNRDVPPGARVQGVPAEPAADAAG